MRLAAQSDRAVVMLGVRIDLGAQIPSRLMRSIRCQLDDACLRADDDVTVPVGIEQVAGFVRI